MGSPIFYLMPNGGNGYSPDGTLPPGAVICTQEQYATAQSWDISSGKPVAIPPPTPSISQQAQAALSAGLTITSTSTPSLNGLYAVDSTAQARITSVQTYIQANGKFPGSNTTMAWVQMNGTPVVFPSTEEFQAFGTAVANYVWDLDEIILTNSGSLPPASVTIS